MNLKIFTFLATRLLLLWIAAQVRCAHCGDHVADDVLEEFPRWTRYRSAPFDVGVRVHVLEFLGRRAEHQRRH